MSSVANTVGEKIGSPTMKVCKGIIIAQIAFDVNHYDAQRRTERQPPTMTAALYIWQRNGGRIAPPAPLAAPRPTAPSFVHGWK